MDVAAAKIKYKDIVNVTAFNLHVEWSKLRYQQPLFKIFKRELGISVNKSDHKLLLPAEKDT